MKNWRTSRLGPALIIAATLGLVMSPVRQNWARKPQDSFPLSYYPMFSARRGEAYSSPSLVGWTGTGERRIVPYSLAGGGGFNEVRRQVRTLIGNKQASEVCRKVAGRLSRTRRPELAAIERVQVITATHDLDGYFHGNKRAVKERVHATCPVVQEREQEKGQ